MVCYVYVKKNCFFFGGLIPFWGIFFFWGGGGGGCFGGLILGNIYFEYIFCRFVREYSKGSG